MSRLRLAFMGTPPFAARALAALVEAGYDIRAVYTQPPRPAGRGHKTVPSAVHQLAQQHGFEVRHPASLRPPETQAEFAALDLDVAVVAAYGLILPKPILAAPKLGCFNIHASLLPRWRGAAPIQRAILAGDAETGVTIMRMEAGLDTGPMLVKRAVPIGRWTTAASLTDELADLGAQMIVEALAMIAAGTAIETPQPEEGITYAAKLDRTEGLIDWSLAAAELDRKVRALNPWPGAYFMIGPERIKLLEAAVHDARGPAGTLLAPAKDGAPVVACGEGALQLVQLQRPGRTRQDGAAFLRGFELKSGSRLEILHADALEAHDRV
ncbi:MAG TPA: methionyl-tRNA formyltransferase [Alphaproteobacteria bacterium]|nr:methionyl-tRNA formyltransferase [Alphaproteobacteria bacterium]